MATRETDEIDVDSLLSAPEETGDHFLPTGSGAYTVGVRRTAR